MLDETFATEPEGWLNQPGGPAWYADGAYWLEAREPGSFVAIDAPAVDAFQDGIISARFHKAGGPLGGGYGVIVADQGPHALDGVYQGGQFLVFEVGDQELIGAWQRKEDHWIDLAPWQPSAAVHQEGAANDLMIRAEGQQLTFFVNDTQVAQISSKLPAGRVGVFVGGDGNRVALEHFTVEMTGTPTTAPRLQATATPKPPPAPTLTPTPNADSLLAQLDAEWGQSHWPEVLSLLDRIESVAPSALDFQDKRYAVHMAAGQGLLTKGDPAAAAAEFNKAQAVDPSRGEAKAALVALTPTPTPAPTADVRPEIRAYIDHLSTPIQTAGEALTTLGAESTRMSSDPMLYLDSNWRVRVALALASLKRAGQQLQAPVAVPPEAKRLNDLVVSIGSDFIFIADEFAAGLDSLDSARIQRATARLNASMPRINQATDELLALKAKYGL